MLKYITLLALVSAYSFAFADTDLDSLLTDQYERAGIYANDLFVPLQEDVGYLWTREEILDYRFLLANLPLADLATMTQDDLMDNVRLAQKAISVFPWGSRIPRDIYLHFVLPHRMTQEPYVRGWRQDFMEEIGDRVRNLDMYDAALEINHWCFEKATFVQTDARDQDPLTTIKAGYGRCEEEMILAVAAFRSVGIPARQCYTPYWAHSDNNHAWVEVWVDGQWYYLGACEPEPVLNQAWFTGAAARAMMVVSTAYGDYSNDEDILHSYGRVSLLNSTPIYGTTKHLKVKLFDRKGKAVADKSVIFALYNFGGWLPITGLRTDDRGEVVLECGVGDLLVSAGWDDEFGMVYVTADMEEVVLKTSKKVKDLKSFKVRFTPPMIKDDAIAADIDTEEVIAREIDVQPVQTAIVPKDSLFQERMKISERIRNNRIWEWGHPQDKVHIFQDIGMDSVEIADLVGILEKARGNWTTIYEFFTGISLTSDLPQITVIADRPYDPDLKLRFILLKALSDKDLLDFSVDVLRDHYEHTTIDWNLNYPDKDLIDLLINSDDTPAMKRIVDYVIKPRLDYEPSFPWRKELIKFFDDNPVLVNSKDDSELFAWLNANIKQIEVPDRLGPPLTPIQLINLGNGTVRDVQRLYAAICRVRGIPARFNPFDGGLEIWKEDEWIRIIELDDSNKNKPRESPIPLTILPATKDSVLLSAAYYKDWLVQRWDNGVLRPIYLGFHTPLRNMEMPVMLPQGKYMITYGKRDADGSALVRSDWFVLKKSKGHRVYLNPLEKD